MLNGELADELALVPKLNWNQSPDEVGTIDQLTLVKSGNGVPLPVINAPNPTEI